MLLLLKMMLLLMMMLHLTAVTSRPSQTGIVTLMRVKDPHELIPLTLQS